MSNISPEIVLLVYATALAKAMSELKLKSPLQKVEENGAQEQSGGSANGSPTSMNRDSWTLPRQQRHEVKHISTWLNHPLQAQEAPRGIDQREPMPAVAGPLWRRKALNGAVDRSPSAADVDGFASLRRGRENVSSISP